MQGPNFSGKSFLGSTLGFVLAIPVYAGNPVWTFAPLTATNISVTTNDTATVQYTVTNQSHQSHTLQMKPIRGIAASGCTDSLGYLQSCTLNLQITGSSLQGDILGGPVLCEQKNPIQCYQPDQANRLSIRLTQQPPIQQYTVTSSAENNGTISLNGTQTVSPGTTLTFTATPNANYGVNQWLVDGNLAQTGGTTYQLANISANHSVHVTFGTVTLTPSVSTLGLSVNCPTTSTSSDCAQKNAALTGVPRTITIKNTGSVAATNVVVTPSGLPSDTMVSPLNCNTIAANGGECVITVTPGAKASEDTNNALCNTGQQPQGSVNITADGGLATSVATYILSYGCIYQGGFIYSIDDTTNATHSIGGKVAALEDSILAPTTPTASTPNWGGSGCAIGVGPSNPLGANDGAANSANIIKALTTDFNAPPCSLSSAVAIESYAAGTCSKYSTLFDQGLVWYLPSVCELTGLLTPNNCTVGSTNMLRQLYLLNPAVGNFVELGIYWSSTESFSPSNVSTQAISMIMPAVQASSSKEESLGVRCSRALIP